MTRRPLPEHVLEALADRATQGFSAEELGAAQALLTGAGVADDRSFDLAAAALDVALGVGETMPETVRASLTQRAREWGTGVTDARSAPTRSNTPSGVAGRIAPSSGARALASLGWLAAAACLALAAVGWLRHAPSSGAPSDSALLRRPDTIRWAWQAAADSRLAGLEGEVIFNPTTQQGSMRLRNLPALDPATQQYQLWIVDPDRKQPVDGGVFDAVAAGPSGEAVIPINAKLRVDKPGAFAITIERRGGVVVSDGPLAAVAAPPKG